MFDKYSVLAGLVLSVYSIFVMVVPTFVMSPSTITAVIIMYVLSVTIPTLLWVSKSPSRFVTDLRINFVISAGIVTIATIASFFFFMMLDYHDLLK